MQLGSGAKSISIESTVCFKIYELQQYENLENAFLSFVFVIIDLYKMESEKRLYKVCTPFNHQSLLRFSLPCIKNIPVNSMLKVQ